MTSPGRISSTPFGWRRSLFAARLIIALIAVATLIVLLCAYKPWSIASFKKIQNIGTAYSWWAALWNLIPLGILFFSAGRWTQPISLADLPRPVSPRGFRAVVLAAMLVSAGLGAFRLNDSFWDDEEYSMRRAILGTYRTHEEGHVQLKELPWAHTFWYYTKPTNHIFQSILSRLCLSAWRTVARPVGLQFNETAVRLPGYLAGVLSIGALALLLLEIGFPWEGALAAWLLALHPWHLRLAPEARGYGLVLLLIPVCCLFAIRSINSGAWHWWIALVLAEFALLYTWPPALVTVLILNGCILLRLVTDDRLRPDRKILISRWFASSLFAAMLLFQLVLPCVPQFREYMKDNMTFSFVNFWLKNVGSLMLTGTLWSKTGQKDPPYPEMWPLADAHPFLFGAAIIVAVLLIGWGTIRLWNSTPRGRGLSAVFLIPGPLMVLVAILQHTYLFEWYVAFMLPGLAALAAIGTIGFARIFSHLTKPRWIPITTALLVIAAFFALTNRGRAFLLNHPAQPFRESVLLTRPNLNPDDPLNLKILTVTTVATPELYDPLIHRANTLDDYIKMMKMADEKGLPLYANNGFPLALKEKYPEISALLADQSIFEPILHLYAIEEMLDRTVQKYRPGSVKTADFSRYMQKTAPEAP